MLTGVGEGVDEAGPAAAHLHVLRHGDAHEAQPREHPLLLQGVLQHAVQPVVRLFVVADHSAHPRGDGAYALLQARGAPLETP
eukprot:1015322-Prorocentrum_minimum.AAC.1